MENVNIKYSDLKPENILLDSKKADATIRIIDFGTSIAYDPDKKLTQKFGTVRYFLYDKENNCFKALLYCS